ncbi:MAG: hypothetical protein P8046_08440 [Anaerolineales bacterium]
MNRLSTWLTGVSKGWVVILSVLIFVLFMIFVLPDQAAKAELYTQGGDSPDMSFFYTPGDLFQMAEGYGEEGRQAYIRARFTFDLIFPMVYGLFLITTISWFASRIFPIGSRWRRLNLVPAVGVLCDLLENSAASIVMASYPKNSLLVGWLASGFTLLKWAFVYGSFFVLLIIGIIWLYKQVKKSNG